MTYRTLAHVLAAAAVVPCVVADAQTGIGTFVPDHRVALHVVASPLNTNGPLRLQGLTAGATETSLLVAGADGTIHYRPAADLLAAAGDNLGDHTATENVVMGPYWLSGDGDDEGLRVTALGDVGIGTATPDARLSVVRAGAGADAELLVRQATINQSAGLRLIEGGYTQDFGFHLRYDGDENRLTLGRHNGGRYLAVARNTGHFAIGADPAPTLADRLWVGGQTRIAAYHPLHFGDDDAIAITRFADAGADALDLTNTGGGVHVHATDLLVTNPAIDPVAYFEGGTQRTGFGVAGAAGAPTTTVHVAPANGDRPLRIEDLTETPDNGNKYYLLLVDDDGVVYKSSERTKGNPSGPPPATLSRVGSANEELAALRHENIDLRGQLTRLRAQVDALARAFDARGARPPQAPAGE